MSGDDALRLAPFAMHISRLRGSRLRERRQRGNRDSRQTNQVGRAHIETSPCAIWYTRCNGVRDRGNGGATRLAVTSGGS